MGRGRVSVSLVLCSDRGGGRVSGGEGYPTNLGGGGRVPYSPGTTKADGTHPTGMISCSCIFLLEI